MTTGTWSITNGLPRMFLMLLLREWSSILKSMKLKFICARNILPESYLSDITYNNQTYIDLFEGAGMLSVLANMGPHWPKMVIIFVCNISSDIVDPGSPMFHQVKLRGRMFTFNPDLINKNYGRRNEGITSATLKLGILSQHGLPRDNFKLVL
ncbi:hypothetical protein LIER_35097 [Lithospermum erythrorhizon]|uniref:Uncharacterized protein n=1 Tax=Lithospermum erythrorhizon TaxID=34254 RepID=A0AAV3NKN4_LITER